jgi:hypothetical protein
MDLAMVKQEQGETLCQYMCHFFDKRATVVDVTDKEVIDLFQDGLYHCRTFEDFDRRHPSSITKLKDMITSWADEEDKADAKYNSIRGKSKNNTGGNNNKDQGGRNNNYSVPNRDNKSRLYIALRRTTPKRPLAASETSSKRSARGIWMAITQPTSATNFGEHTRTFSSHGLVTTRRARRKSMKATTTYKNLTRR